MTEEVRRIQAEWDSHCDQSKHDRLMREAYAKEDARKEAEREAARDPTGEKMPVEWAQIHGWVVRMEDLIHRARNGWETFFDIDPDDGDERIETDPAWAEHPQTLLEFIEPYIRFLITQEACRMNEEGDLVGDEGWDCKGRDEYIAYLEAVIEHLNAELGAGTFVFSDRLRRHLEESPGSGWCFQMPGERNIIRIPF